MLGGGAEKTVFDVVTFEDLTPVSFSQCLEPCKESWDLKENQCQDLCEVCIHHRSRGGSGGGGLRRRCESRHVATDARDTRCSHRRTDEQAAKSCPPP